jgi:hypothetical protein
MEGRKGGPVSGLFSVGGRRAAFNLAPPWLQPSSSANPPIGRGYGCFGGRGAVFFHEHAQRFACFLARPLGSSLRLPPTPQSGAVTVVLGGAVLLCSMNRLTGSPAARRADAPAPLCRALSRLARSTRFIAVRRRRLRTVDDVLGKLRRGGYRPCRQRFPLKPPHRANLLAAFFGEFMPPLFIPEIQHRCRVIIIPSLVGRPICAGETAQPLRSEVLIIEGFAPS